MKYDVLLDLFFKDLPVEKRLGKIAACGYEYAETWEGGNAALLGKIKKAGEECGISLVSIVMNFDSEDGVAPVRAENLGSFMERIDRYSDNALAAGCGAGIVTSGRAAGAGGAEDSRKNLVLALSKAGELAREKGFALNLEPLNTVRDHPGYYLDSRAEAAEIIGEVGLSSVKMLYDIYHMEIMSGNQTEFILENLASIGHFHSAGVPGRHEPFTGETSYPFIIEKIREAGYSGFFGLEYFPLLESGESLRKTLGYLQNDSA